MALFLFSLPPLDHCIRFSLRSLTDTVYRYDNVLVWYCYGSEIFIFQLWYFWMMTRRNWWCQNGANVCFVAGSSRSSIMTTLFIQLILLLLKLYHTIVLKFVQTFISDLKIKFFWRTYLTITRVCHGLITASYTQP